MSVPIQSFWRRLIDNHKAAFAHQGHPILPEINSESALRVYFESLCRKHGDRYPARALFKLKNNAIDAFTAALDVVLDLRPPNTLAGVAYGSIYAVTLSGCDAGLQLTDIVESLGQLNHAVPRLGTELPRYAHDPSVLRPLQDIFGAYVEALYSLAGYFRNHSSDPHRLKPQNAIDHEKFALLCQEKSRSCKAAMERAEKEMKQPGFSSMRNRPHANGAHDLEQHPYDTQARFKAVQKLGHGSFGQVDMVVEVTTGNVYARKNILLGQDHSTMQRRLDVIEKEFRIMEKLTHPHITTVMFWLRSEEECSIIMKPACEMNLRNFFDKCTQDNYPPDRLMEMLQWPGCLLKALNYAHRRHIIHKDIKPSNILIKDNQIYLADFGMAKEDMPGGELETFGSLSQWGHAMYRAPEVTPGHPHARGEKSDVFSLGCVFSEILTIACRRSMPEYQRALREPGDEVSAIAYRLRLPQVKGWLNSLPNQYLDSDIWDALYWQTSCMLRENPEKRCSAKDGITFLQGNSSANSLFCAYDC